MELAPTGRFRLSAAIQPMKIPSAFVVYSLIGASLGPGQEIITTVAGGRYVFPLSASGGPAISAPISDIRGVAVDSAGNVYASDASDSLVFKISPKGILTIVAGNGTTGFSGDGGPASLATLAGPSGLAVDAEGNLFIADSQNDRVRKVGKDGTISTVAGGADSSYTPSRGNEGPAKSAHLSGPVSVAVDPKGNLYIAEQGFHEVRVVDTTGIIHAFAGGQGIGFFGDGGPAIDALLFGPQGVAVDPKTGNVFIADTLNDRVRMVTPDGIINTVAGTGSQGYSGDGGPAPAANIASPAGLSVDSVGNVYFGVTGVDDSLNHMRKFTPGGAISSVGQGQGGSVVAADGSGDLFFGQDPYVREIDSNGNVLTIAGSGMAEYYGDGGPATLARLAEPQGVALDKSGSLYISDSFNDRIRKVAPDGTISTVAGSAQRGFAGDGGLGIDAQLFIPMGLAVDASGNLYIVDEGNHAIRKLTPDGIITTVAGTGQPGFTGEGGLAIQAQLNHPVGVAVDAGGTLYIADAWNFRVRAVAPDGTIRTVAGTGSTGFSGDGGPAKDAMLAGPSGVALDAAGNLYIVDSVVLEGISYSNQRIRKVDPKGVISTIVGTGWAGYTGDGGLAIDAELCFPQAIALDLAGNIYIMDAGNGALRMIDTAGVIRTIATGNMASGDYLKAGGGVAADAAGNAFFSEFLGNDVKEATPSFVPYLVTPAAYNAATLAAPGPGGLAPGSLVSLFGFNLASGTATAGSGSLPTTLLDTSVKIGGLAAPLLYVSANQVNLQIPLEARPGQTTLEVSRPSAGTVQTAVTLDSASPGIFRIREVALNQGAILTQDGDLAAYGAAPGLAARPANPGKYVSIYCTGLGDVTNRPAPGAPGLGGPPYSETLATPVVTIGGHQATVTFSGLTPNYAGLYQVNVQVPMDAAQDCCALVTISVGNASDTATMGVQ